MNTLDDALKEAKKSLGDNPAVEASINRFKASLAKSKASKKTTSASGLNLIGGDASADMATIGQDGSGFNTMKDILKKTHAANRDTKLELVSFKSMFGLTSSDLNKLISGVPSSTLVSKLTKSIIKVEDIISIPNDIVSGPPSVADYIDGRYSDILDSLPDGIEEATDYLNDVAGSLMSDIQSNIPAIPLNAQEGIDNLISVYQEVAATTAGNLTAAAQSVLSGVDVSVTIPTISSLQAAGAVRATFRSITNIQAAQYAQDCLDHALAMEPEIEAALAAFDDYTVEVEFSLDAIGSYWDDITNTGAMESLVSDVLDLAPPIQQCSQRVASVISSANNAIATTQSRISDVTSTIDSITSFFS